MPFGKLQAGYPPCCGDVFQPFTEECLPSGHSTTKAWLVECFRDGCPSRSFSHLHRGTLELYQSDHWVLGHLLTKALLPWLLSLASSRKSLGGYKRLAFKNDLSHSVLGDLQCCRNVLTLFPRSVPRQISTDNSWLGFLLWHALWTVGPYIDRCVPFKIMSNQFNLPRVDSNQVINRNRMHLSPIESHSKGSE